MKGKCLECENYYLEMRFKDHTAETVEQEIHACTSPDVLQMRVPEGHPFRLDNLGHDIEVLECNSFEPKKEDKP